MLFVIRHGLTAWNAPPKRCQGNLPVELCDEGRDAARNLAPTLPSFQVAYTSHLVRARETAEILLSAAPSPPPVRVDRRLAEAACGSWEGLFFSEIKQRWPEEWAAVRSDDVAFQFPGGDALEAVRARFSDALAELDERHRDDLALVVTHGGPMRLYLRQRGLLRSSGPGSPPGNLSGFRLEGGRVELLASSPDPFSV